MTFPFFNKDVRAEICFMGDNDARGKYSLMIWTAKDSRILHHGFYDTKDEAYENAIGFFCEWRGMIE